MRIKHVTPKAVLSVFAVLASFAAAAFCLSLFSGANDSIGISNILSYIFNSGSPEHAILIQIRIPRILMALAVGSILGMSGLTMQTIFRNPLVEPYTLGISGGAALGACMGLVINVSHSILPLFGFAGAIAVIAVLYSLSRHSGYKRAERLLLTGIMISLLSSSAIMIIMALSDTRGLRDIVFWTMGNLQSLDMYPVYLMLALSLTGFIFTYTCSVPLNALYLGEEEAYIRGIEASSVRSRLFLITSVMVGAAVSFTGIIGFVGLITPHLFKSLLKTRDHRVLLTASYLGGAIFLLICDTLARTIIVPRELPVGTITGFIGGLTFIFIVKAHGRGRA